MELSIIVPVYNAEKYLCECMESLVSLKIDDYEIIVVNDGSTDNSQAVIDRYAEKYPHLVKSFIQRNSGVSCARNFGIGQAVGRYIGFADSDDYVLPDVFEAFWSEVASLELDIAVANLQRDCDGKIVPDDLTKAKRKKLEAKGIMTGQQFMAASYDYVKDDLKVEPVTKLYRKSFLTENHLDFVPDIRFEDTLFVMQALLCAERVQYFDCDFYRYRMHQGSFMQQKIGTLQIESYRTVISKLYAQIGQVENAKCAYHSQLVSLLFMLHRYGGVKDQDEAKRLLKDTTQLTPKAAVKKTVMMVDFYRK